MQPRIIERRTGTEVTRDTNGHFPLDYERSGKWKNRGGWFGKFICIMKCDTSGHHDLRLKAFKYKPFSDRTQHTDFEITPLSEPWVYRDEVFIEAEISHGRNSSYKNKKVR